MSGGIGTIRAPAVPRLRRKPRCPPPRHRHRADWFTEQHEHSGSSIGFRVKAKLHAEQTPFQTIEIYDTHRLGQADGHRRLHDGDHARQFPLSRDDVAPGAVHASARQARRHHRRRRLRHAARSAQARGSRKRDAGRDRRARDAPGREVFPGTVRVEQRSARRAAVHRRHQVHGRMRAGIARRRHRRFDRSGRPGRRPVQRGLSTRPATRRCARAASSCSRANRRWRIWT